MSYKITTKKFDEAQVEKIKRLLETSIAMGKPRYYEIFVDNLKVVDKTIDISLFDDYKAYLIEDTGIIKILLYSSCATSPRNDKFLFTLNEVPQTQILSEDEIKIQVDKAVNAELEKRRVARMEQDMVSMQEEIDEADATIEQLNLHIDALKNQRRDESRELKFGSILSIAIEQVLKKDANILSKIPIVSSLSGLFSDTKANDKPKLISEENEVESTTKKLPELSGFEEILFSNFNEAEIMQLIDILNAFIKDKPKIKTVFELVQSKN